MSKNNRRQESGWMFLRRSTDAQAEFTQPAIDQQRPMKQSPSRCEGSWAREEKLERALRGFRWSWKKTGRRSSEFIEKYAKTEGNRDKAELETPAVPDVTTRRLFAAGPLLGSGKEERTRRTGPGKRARELFFTDLLFFAFCPHVPRSCDLRF
ncbi:unnamed protein product [Caenorhabditis auriculariae]|uniref:Uncharacterized protein n=1 Tax=Caenorhabditis auriculariae TaxID=2777116 RepID=A0A8S1H642_9PELO|nr:unnamed protein product [Caenorhabditis auriculariae]